LRCTRLGLEFCAVDPAESRRLNRRFRGKNRPGDVLTFGSPPAEPGGDLGEVYLCLPLIRRDARRHGLPFARWLEILPVHGVLHALGFHHDSPEDERVMFNLQRALTRKSA